MDTSTLKTLLDSQDKAYRNSLDIIMKQVNEKVSVLQSKVNDLTTSLEFTQKEVEDLKQVIQQHKQDKKTSSDTIKKLSDDLQSSENCIKTLEERLNYQEDYSRRNNLQIVGVEEGSDEDTWEKTAIKVTKVLEEKLQLPGVQLERAHRMGQRNDQRHRPIIARFTRFVDRETVMRNVTKLRGTRIYVNEDLCPASQAIKRAQLPMLKKAKSEGKVAYFRHTKLIIKDRTRFNETSEVSGAGGASASRGVGSRGASTPDGGVAPTQGGVLAAGGSGGAATTVATSSGDGASLGGASGVVDVSAAGIWINSPKVTSGAGRGAPDGRVHSPRIKSGAGRGAAGGISQSVGGSKTQERLTRQSQNKHKGQ